MGLIKCIDCGAMVSDRAKACPHCGGPIDESVLNHQKVSQPKQTKSLAQDDSPRQTTQVKPQLASQQTERKRVKRLKIGPKQPKEQQPEQQPQLTELLKLSKLELKSLGKHIVDICKLLMQQLYNHLKPSSKQATLKEKELLAIETSELEPTSPVDEMSVNNGTPTQHNEAKLSESKPQSSNADANKRNIGIIAAILSGAVIIAGTIAFFSLKSNGSTESKKPSLSSVSRSESDSIKAATQQENELLYMKTNDVWDVERIKNEDHLNLCEAIINGDVDWFMKLAETYNALPKSLRNGYIQTIYNFIEQNPNLEESAPEIFKNSIYKNTLNLAEISNELRKLIIEADSIAKSVEPNIAKIEIKDSPKPSPTSVSKPSSSSSSHSSKKHSSKKHSSKK